MRAGVAKTLAVVCFGLGVGATGSSVALAPRLSDERVAAAERRALSALTLAAAVKPPAPRPEPPARAEAKALELPLLDVTFETGSSRLTPSAEGQLAQVAAWLAAERTSRIQVEGHADSRGDLEKNRLLARQRADVVGAYLVQKGIDRSRVEVAERGIVNEADHDPARHRRARLTRRP